MNKLQPLYIDASILKNHGACDIGRAMFRKTFGSGRVLVTNENFKRAVLEAELPVAWLPEKYAEHLGVDNWDRINAIFAAEDPEADHSQTDENGRCLGCLADARKRVPLAWREIQRLRRIAAKQGASR